MQHVVLQVREGVVRVDNLRGEDGLHLAVEIALAELLLLVRELVPAEAADVVAAQQPLKPQADRLPLAVERAHGGVYGLQLLAGVMPERESRRSGSTPMRSKRLPTRIMKNSSRLLVKMLANLSRSRSGTLSSAASARTRRVEGEPAQLAVLRVYCGSYADSSVSSTLSR